MSYTAIMIAGSVAPEVVDDDQIRDFSIAVAALGAAMRVVAFEQARTRFAFIMVSLNLAIRSRARALATSS